MMYYMGHTYHTYDVHCPYHKNDVRFPDPLAHDLYLTDLDTNLSQSPGPGQAKPEPSPGWWLWPGLGFSKAKARASRPKPGQNITMLMTYGFPDLWIYNIFPFFAITCTPHVSFLHFPTSAIFQRRLVDLEPASITIWNKNTFVVAFAVALWLTNTSFFIYGKSLASLSRRHTQCLTNVC